MNYHVGRAGQQLGVYPEETIRAMLQRGELRPDDLGWREGQGDWQSLGQLFGAATPPPVSSAGGVPPPPQLSAAGARGLGGGNLPPPKPGNNLVPAILVTLFCCLPFGIASIVFASQVDSKYAAGDYAGAEASLAKSKLWMWWALGVGLAVSVVWLGLVFLGAMAEVANGRM
jgi:hypothetical protein